MLLEIDCSYVLFVFVATHWAHHSGWRPYRSEKMSPRPLKLVFLLTLKGGSRDNTTGCIHACLICSSGLSPTLWVSECLKKVSFCFPLPYCWTHFILLLTRTYSSCIYSNSSWCSCKVWIYCKAGILMALLRNCSCMSSHGLNRVRIIQVFQSDSVAGYLLAVVAYIRMKGIRHGWVLLLAFLASGREWVPGCICSIKQRHLKWDRGWQPGQVENPVQNTQIYHVLPRNNEEGKNHTCIFWI